MISPDDSDARVTLIMCIVILVALAGATLVTGSGPRGSSNPGMAVVMETVDEGTAANLTYLGGRWGGSDSVLFASNVTVEHNGSTEMWNGATEKGVIRRGSTHVVTGVEQGDTIRVVAHDSQFEDPAIVELTV